ncbi:MAG TPA: hypothetical protein VGZ52_06860 [Acidimicrobiales bacterium]|nr:hypothetical protein [Acidimicrobiales bacterium]
MQRWLVAVLVALAACAGSSPTRADQGRSIAEQAGLPKDVADFFALATSAPQHAYRVTLETKDAQGKPLQVTTTQRPPDLRVDTFHDDGTIDATLSVKGERYQCTMAANHWDCGDLGAASTSSGGDQVFGATAVQTAIDQFKTSAADYDFRVETRTITGASASCLVTTRKQGQSQDPPLGASATLCLSHEGAILLAQVPTGALTATGYTTTIPDDAFTLPAPVTAATASAAPTTAN